MSGRIRAFAVGFVVLATVGCSGGKGGFSDPVDHLQVSPDGATIDTSTSIAVRAVGVTRSGRHVDVSNVTWSATAGSVDASSNFSDTTPGDAVLTATASGKTGTGTIHVSAPGTMNVFVVDATTGTGISGANVALVTSAGTSVITGQDGHGTLTGSFSGAVGVHVVASNYVPMTVYDVKARAIRVPLRPTPAPLGGSFKGTIDFTQAYGQSDPPSGSLWVGIAGPSIKGNILAFGIDSLLGPNRPVSLGGINLDAPSNVYVHGVTPDYTAPSPDGQVAAWALGGEITLQQITSIIGGGTSDLGAVITQLLPTFNTFYLGYKDGLSISEGQTLQGQDLTLTTKLSKVETLKVPPRPVTDPNPFVVGALDLGAEGLMPAGLTLVQGANADSTTINVPPLSGDFAGKTYAFLTVAQEGGLGSGSSDQQIAVLSRGITGQSTVDMPEFLVPPAIGSFSANGSTHVVSYPATADAQFTLQTFTHTAGTGSNAQITMWDVATDGASSGYTLPMVAGTNGASSGAAWTVQSVGLESQTYEGVLSQGAPVDLSTYFGDANRIVISHSSVQ